MFLFPFQKLYPKKNQPWRLALQVGLAAAANQAETNKLAAKLRNTTLVWQILRPHYRNICFGCVDGETNHVIFLFGILSLNINKASLIQHDASNFSVFFLFTFSKCIPTSGEAQYRAFTPLKEMFIKQTEHIHTCIKFQLMGQLWSWWWGLRAAEPPGCGRFLIRPEAYSAGYSAGVAENLDFWMITGHYPRWQRITGYYFYIYIFLSYSISTCNDASTWIQPWILHLPGEVNTAHIAC